MIHVIIAVTGRQKAGVLKPGKPVEEDQEKSGAVARCTRLRLLARRLAFLQQLWRHQRGMAHVYKFGSKQRSRFSSTARQPDDEDDDDDGAVDDGLAVGRSIGHGAVVTVVVVVVVVAKLQLRLICWLMAEKWLHNSIIHIINRIDDDGVAAKLRARQRRDVGSVDCCCTG